ncbi:MAG: choice-of-anchor D domain-containing protein [Methylococcales bacterium]
MRSGATWSQQAYLKASNTGYSDNFGVSVAISGDTVVVGAPGENSNATGVNGDQSDNSADYAGAAYGFLRSGATWSQQVYLKASNTGSDDEFGVSVAISGDTVVVGAPFENSNATGVDGNQSDDSASYSGAAYVFKTTFTIGGTVSALSGSGLVLQNNGGDNLPIASNGAFTFASALTDGSAYNVTVQTQPGNPSQTCTVGNGSGTLSRNVTNVTVSCTNTFTVGGTVSGLVGSGLVLQNNSGDNLSITSNGSFTFATALTDGSAYSVTVQTQPGSPTQTCAVGNGSGNLSRNVTNVIVSCTTNTFFTVGGLVSGLSGSGLVLQNNAGEVLPIASNGTFTFAIALTDGSAYNVTVHTQPGNPNQSCTVGNGSGNLFGANVTNITVTCQFFSLGLSTNNLAFGFVQTGTSASQAVTLSNAVGAAALSSATAESIAATLSTSAITDLIIRSISAPAAPFSITGGTCPTPPIMLAPAESCTIEVTFNPTQAEHYRATIEIVSNAASSPDSVSLRGHSVLVANPIPALNRGGLILLVVLFMLAAAFGVRGMGGV